jgi:hypothetical protein
MGGFFKNPGKTGRKSGCHLRATGHAGRHGQKRRPEIARKMKNQGITVEQIAGDTGLALRQIGEL